MTTERLRRTGTLLWLPVALVVPVCLVSVFIFRGGTSTNQRVLIEALINLIIVVGLYIFVGPSGILHFGHIAFVAIGAYVAAFLTIPPAMKSGIFPLFPDALSWILDLQTSPLEATVLAGVVSMSLAVAISPALMRLGGVQASIATFAFLIIVHDTLLQADNITGGTSGIFGVPQSTTLTSVLVWAALTILVAALYGVSRHGLMLRAARDNERTGRASGIRVPYERSIAFAISAFFLGVAGSLFAQFEPAISPVGFYVDLTFLTVAMLVIGGKSSLTGAVVGVAFISTVQEVLRGAEISGVGPVPAGSVPGMTQVALALILLGTLILRPGGITSGRDVPTPSQMARRLGLRRRRETPGQVVPPASEPPVAASDTSVSDADL